MPGCDYCDEGLPLRHWREPDEHGLEPGQLIPCQLEVKEMHVLDIMSRMIDAGFSRDDVGLIGALAAPHFKR